ncbi:MAG: polysaccharide lyase [Oligoflexus sp.]
MKNSSLHFLAVLSSTFFLLHCSEEKHSELQMAPQQSLSINFSRWQAGQTYTLDMAKSDFASIITGQPQVARNQNISIDANKNLSFRQEPGKVAATGGGGQILIPIQPSNEYTLEYQVYFDGNGGDYHWTWGGKLPGVGGGKTYFGGEAANAGDGFSARFMFGGGGRIFAYTYHKDMPGKYGDPMGIVKLNAFQSNKWHSVRVYYKLNTGSNFDGVLRAWVDGALVGEKTDVRYRTNASQIDLLHIPIFHGGQGPDYEPNKEQYIKISNIYLSWQAASASQSIAQTYQASVGGYTCEEQKSWNKCSEQWMTPVCDYVCRQ